MSYDLLDIYTDYLVTNDLESSADRIYKVYKKRWRIEEYHKIDQAKRKP